jgi:polyhydroxyalkanoate synthase
MMNEGDVERTVDGAADALMDLAGAHELPVDVVTPSLFGRSLARAARSAFTNPFAVAQAAMELSFGTFSATLAAASRAMGHPVEGPVPVTPRDRRFDDPAWTDNAAYYLLRQTYLLQSTFVERLVEASNLDERERTKAAFAAGLLVDAMAPTNTLVGNPAALRRAVETGGLSVLRGAAQLVRDIVSNGGWPSQVDASGFVVGDNTAATPGRVVYRSRLIELIQYDPQTPDVHEVPLLFCPPWINKYYIMDLAPGRSLIEWAVKQGHTCFAISYRNPDASMRDVTFEDYLHGGPRDAARVVTEITERSSLNTVSVCLGGTLSAMAMAYDARRGMSPVNTATFINTHTDFQEQGQLGAFTDEATIDALEKRMEAKGYLDAREMARTFDLLRANDLVFQYVVNNWLLGHKPPAFDLLAWNADATRMPARMHSRYLRSCFLRNEFARKEFVVDGERLDPSLVGQETYVLSAIDDHIVPWTSAYRTTQVLGGRNRFVLSTSGHIAGIVNPPGRKARHWANEDTPADPQQWLAGAALREASWWEDWACWIGDRAGRRVSPPVTAGNCLYPDLGPAPGTYVLERAR